MKKCFFFPVLLLAVSLSAQVRFGLKGGLTHSWQQYAEGTYDETADLTVWQKSISGVANFRLSRLFSIEVEPGWAQRGAKCFPGWVSVNRDDIFIGDYVELPVSLQIEPPRWKRWSLFVGAGGNIAWLAKAVRMIKYADERPGSTEKIDFKQESYLNRYDPGIQAYAGLSFKLGPGQILADTRYYQGFKDVTDFSTSKNHSWDFRLGYVIGVGGE